MPHTLLMCCTYMNVFWLCSCTQDGNSALLKACQGGYVSIAKKLCERRSDSSPTGANVNQTNNVHACMPTVLLMLRGVSL